MKKVSVYEEAVNYAMDEISKELEGKQITKSKKGRISDRSLQMLEKACTMGADKSMAMMTTICSYMDVLRGHFTKKCFDNFDKQHTEGVAKRVVYNLLCTDIQNNMIRILEHLKKTQQVDIELPQICGLERWN